MQDWLEALPKQFQFYHLGSVELIRTPEPEPSPVGLPIEDMHAISFLVQGEERGLLILLFDRGLEIATYMEMGNVIASQLADRLSRSYPLGVTISPPKNMATNQLDRIVSSFDGTVQSCAYLHLHQNRSIQVTALLMRHTQSRKGVAHA